MVGHGYFCQIVFHNLHVFLKISNYLPPNGPHHCHRELPTALWVNSLCLPEVRYPACVLMEGLGFQTMGNNQPAFSQVVRAGPCHAAEKSQGSFNLKKKIHLFVFGCAGSLSCQGFFLVVMSGGYGLVPTRGLLFAVASLPVECGL